MMERLRGAAGLALLLLTIYQMAKLPRQAESIPHAIAYVISTLAIIVAALLLLFGKGLGQ